MTYPETILFFITIALYVISTLIYLYSLLLEKERWTKFANIILASGLITNLATMVVRYGAVHHLPVKDSYELNLFGSFIIVTLFLISQKLYPAIRYAGIAAVPFALFMLGYALVSSPDMSPLNAAYKSYWLYVHVIAAFFSYASWGIGVGCSIMYFKKEKKKENNPFFNNFPTLPLLDEYTFKFVAVGFVANTIMLTSGSMWAKDLWGSYWSWDPLETWSLIAWLVYALYLHLKLTLGWKGKSLAVYNVIALFVVIISFWGLPYLMNPSLLSQFHY